MHAQARFYYSSYTFNGGNFLGGSPPVQRYPGIAGLKVSDITNPPRTILVLEFPALVPYSWHQPTGVVRANNVRGNATFVDGHASYPKFFWDEKHAITNTVESWHYDPPSGYDYQWSGNF